jgi:hypothetical protein
LVVVTIALASASVIYSDRQNDEQDRCVARQITDLTGALNARSESTGRLNDATGEVINSFVQAARTPDDPDNRGPILEALNHYAQVQSDVKKSRRDNPFPPFPTGQCD